MGENRIAETIAAPHSKDLNKAEFLSKIWMISLFGSTLFSIAKTVYVKLNNSIIIFVSVLVIVFLFLLDKYIQYLKDTGENIRRKSLLDNSFGTKLYTDESNGYYNNVNMNNNAEKLLANVHESALYTKEILKRMLFKQIIFVAIWSIVLITFATIGLNKFPFALNILDFF